METVDFDCVAVWQFLCRQAVKIRMAMAAGSYIETKKPAVITGNWQRTTSTGIYCINYDTDVQVLWCNIDAYMVLVILFASHSNQSNGDVTMTYVNHAMTSR